MDQIKIGKFISSKRKEKGLTQGNIAERLGVSDRAVSKWENGLSMPDYSIMNELCNILGISINELFSGETIDKKDNEKKLLENLIEMTKLKEERDKELLRIEIILGILITAIFLLLCFFINYVEMENYLKVILFLIGFIPFIVMTFYALRIEQVAGYYECSNCHHKYIPTYKNVFFATHINRTRRMKCHNCNKKCWHKKVIR